MVIGRSWFLFPTISCITCPEIARRLQFWCSQGIGQLAFLEDPTFQIPIGIEVLGLQSFSQGMSGDIVNQHGEATFFIVKSSRECPSWIHFPDSHTPKRELPSLAQRANQLCHRLDLSAQRGHANSKRTWKNMEKWAQCRLPKFGYPMIPPSCCTPVQFVLELRVMPPWYESQILAFHSGDLPHPDCFNGGPPSGVLSGWWFWPLPNMVEKTSTNQACYITYTFYYYRSFQNGIYPFYLSNTIIIIVESGKKLNLSKN